MAEKWNTFGKFVRLNLIGEVVEVVCCDSTEITIKFKETDLTLKHYEVSRITAAEAVVAEVSLIST
jgi:hypothetical protein